MCKLVLNMVKPQIYKGDPRTCTIFIPAWGSNWEYSSFSSDQSNCGSSGANVLQSDREDCKTSHGVRRSWTHFVCVCFHVCSSKNPNILNLSSVADDAIAHGSIQGLGSPLYIYGSNLHLSCLHKCWHNEINFL